MVKKCVYCRTDINDNRSLDVCDKCGVGVWGERMFNAIIQNMDEARDKGDLCDPSGGTTEFFKSNSKSR